MAGRVKTHANAAVQAAMETIDMGAKTAIAASASIRRRQGGDQQQDDRAGAGEPVEDADREGLPGAPHLRVPVLSLVEMAVLMRLVSVRARAIVASLPLPQDAEREEEDHDAHHLLRTALEPCGQGSLEDDQWQPDRQKRERVTGSPPRTKVSGRARVGIVGGNERCDRHQVIWVRRVAQAQEEREAQRNEKRSAFEKSRQ